MRVLVVSPHLPPSFLGGVEVYSAGLLRALGDRGHDVMGVAVERLTSAPADGCTAVVDEAQGYPVHRLQMALAPSRVFPLLATHGPAEDWMERHLHHTRPDVVHLQSGYLLGAPTLAAARRTGTPVVLTLHDYWFACPRVTLRHPSGAICSGPSPGKCAWCLTADQRRHRWLDAMSGGALTRGRDKSWLWRTFVGDDGGAVIERQQLLAGLLDSAAAVLAPTRFVANRVAATGFPADRIVTSRCGMPPLSRHVPARADGLRLAYIGQVAPHKGIHLLIQAVRALDDRAVSLQIHGPLTPYPEYVAHLRSLAAGDPRIAFRGPYRREALPDLFAAADVVVAPSTWHEVAALVIQEAQASGVPVLASNLGGSPELIRDGVDGLLFDPETPGDLERQLRRLLDEPGLLRALAAAAPTPRTIDEEVDALLALYASLERVS